MMLKRDAVREKGTSDGQKRKTYHSTLVTSASLFLDKPHVWYCCLPFYSIYVCQHEIMASYRETEAYNAIYSNTHIYKIFYVALLNI